MRVSAAVEQDEPSPLGRTAARRVRGRDGARGARGPHPERRVFQGVTADRLRTAISRACTAPGVPAFSPHDLRHRCISLLHLGGVPWTRIGEHVGQRNLAVTANTYSHVLVDERELDYGELVGA